MKERAIVIVGPTGVGKSDLGVLVAEGVHGEIVSADSMQVYRHMDIGTGKIRPEETRGVPHHLMSVINPDQNFTVAEYVQRADIAMKQIAARGRIPVVVGGTGLYVKALVEDFLFPDKGADWEFRDRMRDLAIAEGNGALHERLQRIDRIAAERLHPNDIRRVIRALEVFENTGVPMSQQISSHGPSERRYDTTTVGLTCHRDELYRRIDLRVDGMIELGLVDEVKALMAAGYCEALTSMQALGYKEIVGYLKGQYDLSTAIDILKRDTRRYAKRQLSWFTKDKDAQWFDRADWPDMKQLARHIALLLAGSLR